ncbi:biofilm PGA synthesis lipoprotein PgaB [Paenibacillaceae bacterium GAS479]|nr:biofilm PGA synthesis lipoprotein PgaB [Paenibacillaceae bacterium GAS479]
MPGVMGRFRILTILLVFVFIATGATGVAMLFKDKLPLLKGLTLQTSSQSELYKDLQPGTATPEGLYYKNKVIVLMYHDVRPDPNDSKSLALDRLDRQLSLLKANNFKIIDMDRYKQFIRGKASVPDNAVLLTFDDGYESFYQYAYPMLRKHGLSATNFIIAGSIDNRKHAGVTKLTWMQIQQMKQDGIDFYSHSYDSHSFSHSEGPKSSLTALLAGRIYLPKLGRRERETEYERRIRSDLRQANTVLLKQIGVRNDVMAFPYGAFSRPLLQACRQEGIDVTLTVKAGLNGPGQYNGFRLNAGGMDNNPDLQIALMKQAVQKLGKAHYERPSLKYALLLLPILGLLIGALWLRSAWELVQEQRLRKKLISQTT